MNVAHQPVRPLAGALGTVAEVVLVLLEEHAALVRQQLLAPGLGVGLLDVGDKLVNILEALGVGGGEVGVGAEHVHGEHLPHGGGINGNGVVHLFPHLVALGKVYHSIFSAQYPRTNLHADILVALHALGLPVGVALVGVLAVALLEHGLERVLVAAGLVDHGALLLAVHLELGVLHVLGHVLHCAQGRHVHVLAPGALEALLGHGLEVGVLPASVHLSGQLSVSKSGLPPRVHLLPTGLPEGGLVSVEALVPLGVALLGGPVPDLGPAPPALVGLLSVDDIVRGRKFSTVLRALHPGLQISPEKSS